MVYCSSQGSGITVDWSQWAFIDRLPGSAVLALKLEIIRSWSSNSSTWAMTQGCEASSAKTGSCSMRS